MIDADPPEGSSESSAVRDAWLEVSDDLLAGVGHALSNRVAALTAVGQVLAATTEGPFTKALSTESSRLQRAVQLLRLLIRRWDTEPEPIRVEDVLKDVVELLGHHPEVRNTSIRLEGAAGLAPVWSERSLLTHALCIVLSVAAEAVERAGEAELVVRCSGTMEEVRLGISFPSGTAAVTAQGTSDEPPAGSRIDPRAARGLIKRSGGELSVQEEDGARTVLLIQLPTLMEIRRREREG